MEETQETLKTEDSSNAIEIKNDILTKEALNNFNERKKIVQKIISQIIEKENFTVNINLQDSIIEKEKLERFIIELMPRLREIGGKLIITNNAILNNTFLEENDLI